MDVANYTEFRQGLAHFMDSVCDSRSPLTVTRQGGRSVVVIAADEFEGMMETIHLLQSPVNAQRVLSSISNLDAGKCVERDIVE
jgi:antitoxin YefM